MSKDSVIAKRKAAREKEQAERKKILRDRIEWMRIPDDDWKRPPLPKELRMPERYIVPFATRAYREPRKPAERGIAAIKDLVLALEESTARERFRLNLWYAPMRREKRQASRRAAGASRGESGGDPIDTTG